MHMNLSTLTRAGRRHRKGSSHVARAAMVATVAAGVLLTSGCANQQNNLAVGYEAWGYVVSSDVDAHTMVVRVTRASRGHWAIEDAVDQTFDVTYRPGDLSCSSGTGVTADVPEGTGAYLTADSGEIGQGNPHVSVNCRRPATPAPTQEPSTSEEPEPATSTTPEPATSAGTSDEDSTTSQDDSDEFYEEAPQSDGTSGGSDGLDPVLTFPGSWGM